MAPHEPGRLATCTDDDGVLAMLAADPARVVFGQPEHEDARLGRPITPIRNAPTREARQPQGGEIVAQALLADGVLRIRQQPRSGVPGGDEGPGANAAAGEESIEVGMAAPDPNLDAAPGGIGHEGCGLIGPLQGRASGTSGVFGCFGVGHGASRIRGERGSAQIAQCLAAWAPAFPVSRNDWRPGKNVQSFLAASVGRGRYRGVGDAARPVVVQRSRHQERPP